MKLYRCETPGVDGTVHGDCLITGVDGGNRLYCIWGETLYEGYLRGDHIFWTSKDDSSPCRVLDDGRIVLDEGTDNETRWRAV
jgi:hypothetical protein